MPCSAEDDVSDFYKMKGCIEPWHVRYTDEPGRGLTDAEFVHRMWDTDEVFESSDEEFEEEMDRSDSGEE